MAYVLQSTVNAEKKFKTIMPGDVVVDASLKSAYVIFKDGSRRHIKDPLMRVQAISIVRNQLDAQKAAVVEAVNHVNLVNDDTVSEDVKKASFIGLSAAAISSLSTFVRRARARISGGVAPELAVKA